MMQFYVDIEDNSGNKLGGGPVASAQQWRYTARMDRAGEFSFAFAANDPQAAIVQSRRIARAKARINGAWVEVGAGVIDNIETVPGNDGRVSLVASGMDLIRELSYRTVGTLEVGAGAGATHAAALTAIGALAPSGWTFTPAASPDNDYIYARYGGESVLGALVYLAERTQTHFYRSTNRTLVFTSDFTDSGVRAIQAQGDLAAEQCAIRSLRRTVDTHDLLTRITPYGSGQGEARLTLAATSRAAPVGYTLNAASNYIENDTATSTYGLVNFPEIEFKEITPISNTDADLEAAADMLFDAALEELRRRSTLAEQETYSLSVAGCSQLLRPMQTLRLVYRDPNQNINIDEDLYILEATWEIDQNQIQTTDLVVSSDDRWPVSDVVAAAERAVEGRVFTAHPQLNANSYVTAYTKNVDENETAAFRFRFGTEVVNLQQVLFEFQILPFESTVRSVGAASATTSSGGSSTATSSSGGGQTATSSSGGGTTVSAGAGGGVVASSSSGGGSSVSSDSGGSSTPTTSSGGSSTPTSSSGGGTSVSSSSGGSVTSVSSSNATLAVGVHNFFGSVGTSYDGTIDAATSLDDGSVGNHTHHVSDVSHLHVIDLEAGTWDHTHDISSTNHNHTISIGDHTHSVTIGNHTHTVSIAAHTHTVTISSHTHTVTIANHTHSVTLSDHTHSVTIANHTHTIAVSNHTHTIDIPAHTHTVLPSITTEYGIFRESAPNTYALADLDYQVNGGGWLNMEDNAVSAGGGWYQLDLTSLVMSSTTLRPLQANNLLEIRSLTIDKTATIDAQLSVRNTIQAIAYT